MKCRQSFTIDENSIASQNLFHAIYFKSNKTSTKVSCRYPYVECDHMFKLLQTKMNPANPFQGKTLDALFSIEFYSIEFYLFVDKHNYMIKCTIFCASIKKIFILQKQQITKKLSINLILVQGNLQELKFNINLICATVK